MKNFVMGLIVGALLIFSGQAFGETNSQIGKTVSDEINVELNGKEIGKGVVISNKSYLPVREVANAIDADIAIDKGGVSLTTSVSPVIPTVDTDAIESQRAVDLSVLKHKKADIEKKISKIPAAIKFQEEKRIPELQLDIERFKKDNLDGLIEMNEKEIEESKALIEQKKAELIELQSQLEQTNQKIAELEAQ